MEQLTRRESWNRVHEAHDRDALSGSNPMEVMRHHDLQIPQSGTRVLDIGVGLGKAARFFSELGCVVDAMDVADKAEATVSQWARKFYLAERPEELPRNEYDLAVSHLVAQHMDWPSVLLQAQYVARSLRLGGIFSLHLAGSRIEGENDWPARGIPEGFDGRMCRTEAWAVRELRDLLLDECEVKQTGRIMDWPKFKSYWYFIHVRKL